MHHDTCFIWQRTPNDPLPLQQQRGGEQNCRDSPLRTKIQQLQPITTQTTSGRKPTGWRNGSPPTSAISVTDTSQPPATSKPQHQTPKETTADIAAKMADQSTSTSDRHAQHRTVATSKTTNEPRKMVATPLGFLRIHSGRIIRKFDHTTKTQTLQQDSSNGPRSTIPHSPEPLNKAQIYLRLHSKRVMLECSLLQIPAARGAAANIK